MKIGILYIAIGKYKVFWKDFFLSSESLFIREMKKYYFVFTDSEELHGMEKENVFIVKQKDLGWPQNTLLRFAMFDSIRNQLSRFDYLFFFNANLIFLKEITTDFLPKYENLLVALHPSYYLEKDVDRYPYCRNPKSKAYIAYGKGRYYVQGALNGGKSEAFLNLISELKMATEEDLKRGVIADVHDESHLNHYILDRNDVKIVGPEYIYPEGWLLNKEPIILSRDKEKYFNVDELKKGKIGYILKKIKRCVKKWIKGGEL